MKHTFIPLILYGLGLFALGAANAEQPTAVSRDAAALIDRMVSDRLGEEIDRIAALEDRVAFLERLVQQKPDSTGGSTKPKDEIDAANPDQVIHVIASGETLSSIARSYSISVADIARANNIAPSDIIFINDRLVIPGGRPTPNPDGRKGPAKVGYEKPLATKGTYTVQHGDTLSRIAVKNGTSIDTLMRANGLSNPDSIWVGQVLSLSGSTPQNPQTTTEPAPPASPSPAPTTEGDESFHYYEVANGDTLSSIAETFFTTVQEIGRLNNIDGKAVVKVGQQLIVPTKAYFKYLREEGVIG